MARILLSEADPDVRLLLEAVLTRRDHEPVLLPQQLGAELPDGDLLLAEPAYGAGLRHAWTLRRRHPSLSIVLVSILSPDSAFLALGPVEYLVKPFPIASLERAVAAALARDPA